MGSVYDWSTTAASNGNSDASVNFQEGQLPPTLNNSARALMARMAAWFKQLGAAITHGGAGNAYTLTLPTGHQITAYATGMRFLWKPNGNSSGSVTLNVDGVGAKKVFLSDGTTQAGSGHILSGRLLDVVYDATLDSATGGFQIVGSRAFLDAQPLDATLTALAALSWASGNALVQFTAADTVSLTLTPSVTSVTASGAGTPGNFKNTTDAANNVGLVVQSDRATPAANDTIDLEFRLSDTAGNQDLFGRIRALGSTVTSASEAGQLRFGVINSGTLTEYMVLQPSFFRPATNDGTALGNDTVSFSDLKLASGAVIGFNNLNVTITHSAGLLTFTGAALIPALTVTALIARIYSSTETTGTLTSASANSQITLTGNITLANSVFTAGDCIDFDPGTSARTITRGAGVTMYLNGTDSASATIAANQMAGVRWRSASVCVLYGAVS